MYSYTLKQIARVIGGNLSSSTDEDILATSAAISTKELKKGGIFIAISGYTTDGHNFLDQAFSSGAVAVVVSKPEVLKGRPGIIVGNCRIAASRLAALFEGEPSRELQCVGVTGTNGKTTIHWMVHQLFEKLGVPALRIGTIGFYAPGISEGDTLTTPDPMSVQRFLRRGLDAGAKAAVMEIGSHALDQHRADDVQFNVAIFTNLTRDHLDYHKTFENYFAAKMRLFELLRDSPKEKKAAIINVDDEFGNKYAQAAKGFGLDVFSYGRGKEARIRIETFDQNIRGSHLNLNVDGKKIEVKTQLIGIHNAYNTAAVFGALFGLGYDPTRIAELLPEIPCVPGRLEPLGTDSLGVYVDYAHTPDALENVLKAVRDLTDRQVWVVFGCGGDRDKGKRPMMAEIARRLADKVIITSDNPRTEDPEQIIKDILSTGTQADFVETDRRAAIKTAIKEARDGDVVLVAGKGHEDYQIIGTTKHHFSDQEEVREALKNKRAAQV